MALWHTTTNKNFSNPLNCHPEPRVLGLKLQDLGHAPTVLCLGAHCDDIEIGCGATLIRWARDYPGIRFVWGIFSGETGREDESRAAAATLTAGAAPCELRFHAFRDRFFPSQGEAIKEAFDALRATVTPDVVFTHFLDDRHQDHRVIGELTWNTFRSHLVLEYEIPKYEGDLGHPNVFVPHTAADLDRKVACLLESFPSQRARGWFTADTFRALARLRGIESGAPSGFAEAFHGRKLCL
jgi:LmbE family N-acetylglucosaminyl deacetylase